MTAFLSSYFDELSFIIISFLILFFSVFFYSFPPFFIPHFPPFFSIFLFAFVHSFFTVMYLFLLIFRTVSGASETRKLLLSILETEKQITGELKILSDLKIFPSQELLLVRKDVKAFKDKTIITKLEKIEKGKYDSSRKDESKKTSGLKVKTNVPEYDEIIEISVMEQLITERKYSLFIERRKDEQEASALLSKKVAKNRATQEVQARDPSNFTNQKRF